VAERGVTELQPTRHEPDTDGYRCIIDRPTANVQTGAAQLRRRRGSRGLERSSMLKACSRRKETVMSNATQPLSAPTPAFPRACPDLESATFGPEYFESLVLTDGRPARMFPLRKEHAAQLQKGFERLSARSRYLRFFTSKRWLGDAELSRLVALDGCNQFAIAVQVRTLAGWEGAAVGRLARVPDAPETAELAITVLDEYQRLGIGRLLMTRLQKAALERGYTHVHGEVLVENRPMLRLLRAALPGHVSRTHGPVVEIDAPLEPSIADS
jgi:GNAT superfamily N-acetyltransferase